MNTKDMITVMQVFDAMNIKPDRRLSWSVGSIVANKFRDIHGHQPPKDNRPKTSGGGSHCFALYHRDWIPYITDVIKVYVIIPNPQDSLFKD